MGTVNCTIDTNELAVSVNGVSKRLDGTAGAVVAMQAAVVASQVKAADDICKNVDRGFLNLMNSQNSMKKAQYFSELLATNAKLMELSKALIGKEDRMEADVERLHRQYYKIFNSIDHALENRVLQLDRPAMQLAANRKDLILSRMAKDLPTVVATDQESHNTAQMAFTARIKSKTSRALTNVSNHAMENEEYKRQVSDVLEPQQAERAETECIPVIYVQEASMVVKDTVVSNVILPEDLNPAARDAIENNLSQKVDVLARNTKSAYEANEITREFNKLLSNANLDPRVAELLQQLYEIGGCQ